MKRAYALLAAANRTVMATIHKIATQCIHSFYVEQFNETPDVRAIPGSITFVQRFGSGLNLNLHLHMLLLEGIYAVQKDQTPKLVTLRAPEDRDIEVLVDQIAKRIIEYLRKKGYIQETPDTTLHPELDGLFDEYPALSDCMQASISSRIAFGPRAGQYVRRIGSGYGYEEEVPLSKGTRCASIHGFSLHANVSVDAYERDKLFRIIKYMGRPAVANERLSLDQQGDILLALKKPYADGTTHLKFSPEELIEKLAALVPLPHSHLVRYSGIFSSHCNARSKVVLDPQARKGKPRDDADAKLVKNTRWSKLLSRCFQVDIATCTRCGGELRIVAAVMKGEEISRYLSHTGRAAQPPPITPARYEQAAFSYDDEPVISYE